MTSESIDSFMQKREITDFQYYFEHQTNRATYLIAFTFFILFVFEELFGGSLYPPTLIRLGANSHIHLLNGELWRLITCIFLHGGFLHLALNTYVLFALGTFFNRLLGESHFFSLWFLSGVGGSVASMLAGSGKMSIGGSGALWGLFGASAALIMQPSHFLPEPLRAQLRQITVLNLGINLAISFLPIVDFWGHIGGGITGFLIAYPMFHVLPRAPIPKKIQEVGFHVIAVMLCAAAAFCFALNAYKQKPWTLLEPTQMQTIQLPSMELSLEVPTYLPSSFSPIGFSQWQLGKLPFDPMAIQIEQSLKNPGWTLQDLQKAMQHTIDSRHLKTKPVFVREKLNGIDTLFVTLQTTQKEPVFLFGQIRANQLLQVQFTSFQTSHPSPTLLPSKIMESMQPNTHIHQ